MEYFSKYKGVKSIQRFGKQLSYHALSVVIPTYNKPQALKRAIQSVLNQVHTTLDYNVVIVENYEGNVGETLKMLSSLDNPLKIEICYFQNEKNINPHPNWNRCFEIANADYVLMLHTDDFLLPRCFECVERAIGKNIPSLIINRVSLYEDDTNSLNKISGLKSKQSGKDFSQSIRFFKQTYRDVLVGITPVAPTGFLAQKTVFLSSGGFNTKSNLWPADLEYAFQLAEQGLLYYCENPFVVKTEGNGNGGSNLKVTLPFIFSDKDIFMGVARKHHVRFRNRIISMRLAAISKGFKIDYDEYLTDLFPKYYLNRFWSFAYRVVKKLQRISLHRR